MRASDITPAAERGREAQQAPDEASVPHTGTRFAHAILFAVLGIILLLAALDWPGRWAEFDDDLTIIGLWGDPERQHLVQELELPHPHYLLRRVDALVPRGEPVLLVTSGRDFGRYEYITFHRALYLLAPRPVWWMSPAPPDGTWKARWWISQPLDAASIKQVARDKGAAYVLAVNIDTSLRLGVVLADLADGTLYWLGEGESTLGAAAPLAGPGEYRQSAGAWWPLQLLGALAVMLGAGWVLVATARRLGFNPSLMESAGLAWVMGAGVVTVLMLWLSWLGIELSWAIGLTTAAVLVLLTYESARRYRQQTGILRPAKVSGATDRKEHQLLDIILKVLLLGFMVGQLILTAADAVGRPLRVWDSWANWAVKARIIFLEGGISPAVYADASRTVTHLDYPLMTPLAEAWLFGWLGAPDDRLVGVLHLLFLVSLVILVYCAVLRVGAGPTWAMAVAAATLSISNVAGLAGIVFAEMPLLVFATVAAIYLYRWLQDGKTGSLFVTCVAAGLLPWTKREGFVLLICLCAGVFLTNLTSRRAWVAAGGMVAAALVLSGPWWVFVAQNRIENEAFGPIGLQALADKIGRWSVIWEIEWAALTGRGLAYLWPMVTVAGPLLWWLGRKDRSWKRRGLHFLVVSAAVYAVLMGFSFFFSDFVPFEQHVLSSIDRLLAEAIVLPLLWLVFITPWPSPVRAVKTGIEDAGDAVHEQPPVTTEVQVSAR